MKTSTIMDWLRYTVPAGAPLAAVDTGLPPFEPTLQGIRALAPYNAAIRLLAGRVDWHTGRDELKTMVTLTGSDIQMCGEMGVGYDTICAMAQRALGAVTRLDLAIDVFDGGKSAHDVWSAYKYGEPRDALAPQDKWRTHIKTRSRTAKFVEGRDGRESTGDTVYFGSRQSDRLIRIYDKGKEQGISADWLRVEVELKGSRAAAVAKQLARGNIEGIARAVIGNAISWDCQYWREVMSGRVEGKPEHVPAKDTDTDAWFAETVLPYLRRQIAAQGKNGLVYTALEALLQELS